MRSTRRIIREQGRPAGYDPEARRWRGHRGPRLGADLNFFRRYEEEKRDKWRMYSRAPRSNGAEQES